MLHNNFCANRVIMSIIGRTLDDLTHNKIKHYISIEQNRADVINSSDNNEKFYGKNLKDRKIVNNKFVEDSNNSFKTIKTVTPTIVEVGGVKYYTSKPINGNAIETSTFATTNAGQYVLNSMLPIDEHVRKVFNDRSGKLAELPKSVVDFYKQKYNSSKIRENHGRNSIPNAPHKNLRQSIAVLSNEFIAVKEDEVVADKLLDEIQYDLKDEVIDLSDKSGFTEMFDQILSESKIISDQHIDYESMPDGAIDKNDYIKVDRKLIYPEKNLNNEFVDIDDNNVELVAECKHNDIDLSNWIQVKEFVNIENIVDNRYLCNSCFAPIACVHLENLFSGRSINIWSAIEKNNVFCKFCHTFVGHIEQLIGSQSIAHEFKPEISQITMSAIHRSTSILRGGTEIAHRLRSTHFTIIYDEILNFETNLRQTLNWDVKRIVIIYGVMFIYIFIVIYLANDNYPMLFIDEPDIDQKKQPIDEFKKIVVEKLIKLSSQDNINLDSGHISTYIVPKFNDVVKIVNMRLTKKIASNKELTASNRSITIKKINARDSFDLNSIIKNRLGLNDEGIAKTFDMKKIKNYSPGKRPKLKIKHPIAIDKHVYEKSKNDLNNSSIVRERSMSLILGCEGNLDQKHIWIEDGDEFCKKCKKHYKELAQEDDAHLRFKIINKDMFVTMKTAFVVKCPAFWTNGDLHDGDPCIHCGWPNIETQEYLDKYSYIFYDRLDVKKVKPIARAPRVRKLSIMSLKDTQFQQQQSFAIIANRFPTEDHLSHLVVLIKQMFHMNIQKFGISEAIISRLFDLHDINEVLFNNKLSSGLLSSVVGSFTKSHEKGNKMVDMGIENDKIQDIELEEDDILTINAMKADMVATILDNADEADELTNNLSDADDDDRAA